MFVVPFKRPGDIYHGQEHKYKGLNETSEYRKKLHRPRQRQKNLKAEQHENSQYKFFSRDVAEQTQGKGQGARKVGDNLNGDHERREPKDRSGKMFEVAEPALFETDVVGGEKDGHGGPDVGVDIACRCHGTGENSDDVVQE